MLKKINNLNFSKNFFIFHNFFSGPVQNLGCLTKLINWLPPYLHAWGSTMMVMVGFQVIYIYIFYLIYDFR
jgi:hypothetical protein